LLGAGALGLAAAGGGGGGAAATKDTTAPTGQTGALSPVAGSDSATLGDNKTNVTKPTITGKAEAGSTVEVSFVDPAGKVTGPYKTTADATGNYSLVVPDNLADNSTDTKGTQYTPVIKATDASGNSSTANGTPFVVDTQAATVPVQIDADSNNDGYINAAEKGSATTTSVTAILDKTKMVAGDVITLSDGINSKTVTLTAADVAAGKLVTTGWPMPTEGQVLNVTGTLKDLAGNVSPVATDAAKLDTAAPNGGVAVGLTIDLDKDDDKIINSSDKGTATTTSLTASFDKTKVMAGDILTFSDGTTSKSVTLTEADVALGKVISSGWVLPNEGTSLTVTAVLKDVAANATTLATDEAKIDTTAPNGGAAVGLTIDLDSNNDGKINKNEMGTNTTTSLTATFDKTKVLAGDIITFKYGLETKSMTLSGDDVSLGKVTSDGWILPTEGASMQVTAVIKDPEGNSSNSASDAALRDTIAPTGQTGKLAKTSDSGVSDSDGITKDDTPTIEGVAEKNTKVEIFLKDNAGQYLMDGGVKVSYTATADANGKYAIQIDKPLADNSTDGLGTKYTPVVSVTDSALNVSEVAGTTFVVDKFIRFKTDPTEGNGVDSNNLAVTKFNVNSLENLFFKSGHRDAADGLYTYGIREDVIANSSFERVLTGVPELNTYVLWDNAGNYKGEGATVPAGVIDNLNTSFIV
jgi:hypothetical protein